MPPVVAAIIAIGGALGVTVSTAIATQIAISGIGLGSSLIIGGIARAIRGKPQANRSLESGQGRLMNIRQAAAARRVIYGTARVGGILTFINTAGHDNRFVDLVITIAGHEVEEVGQMYFDDEPITIDGSGNALGRWFAYAKVEKNLGTDGQAAFPTLILRSPGIWTVDHRQKGCAGVYVGLDTSKDELTPGGRIPNITFDVKGKKLFDPRTDLTAWSANCALVIIDFLMNTRYGMSVDYTTGIHDDSANAAANVCGEAVALGTSPETFEERYSINGVFDFDEDPGEILQQMAGAMGGYIVRVGGQWHIYPGAFRLPVLTLTDSDFIEPIKFQSQKSVRELFNGIKGTFISPDHNWQKTDFPAVSNATYVTQDGGVKRFKDVFFPFTQSASTVQRLAKIELERSRRKLPFECVCKMRAYELIPADFVEITRSRFSWTEKQFEVVESRLTTVEDDDGNPALAIALVLKESDLAVYGFAVDDYGNMIDPGLLNLPSRKVPYGWSPATVKNPASTVATLKPITDYGFGLAQRYKVGADGTVIPQLQITGRLPINEVSTLIPRPRTRDLSAGTANTGGFLKGGKTYYISVCAQDEVSGSPLEAVGRYTALSEIATVAVPAGTNTNTVTIEGLRWHANTQGWVLFFGLDPQRLSRQVEYAGILPSQVSIVGPTAQPTSITFKGFNFPDNLPEGHYHHYIGAPDQRFNHPVIAVQRGIHFGIWGGEVVSVGTVGSPPSQYTITLLVASNFTINVMAGRYVTLMGVRNPTLDRVEGGGAPLADFLIESNTADTLTLTAGQANPADFGFELGSVVVIRTKVTTVGSDAIGNYIEDSGFGQGGQSLGDQEGGDGGLTGMVLRFISGTGAGEKYVIKDNVGDKVYIEGEWIITPDTTTVFIVHDPVFLLRHDAERQLSERWDVFTPIRVDAANLYADQYLVWVFSTSDDGFEADEDSSPYREFYLFGGAEAGRLVTAVVTSPPTTTEFTVTPDDAVIRVDASAGPVTGHMPDAKDIPGRITKITKVDASANVVTIDSPVGSPINDASSIELTRKWDTAILLTYDDGYVGN